MSDQGEFTIGKPERLQPENDGANANSEIFVAGGGIPVADLPTPGAAPEDQPEPGTSIYKKDGSEDLTLEAQLLRYLVDDDIDTYNDSRKVIFANLNPAAFREEAYVLYSVLHKFREKHMSMDAEFLNIYLSRNLKEITQASGKFLDLNAYADLAQEVDPSLLTGDLTDKALLYAGGVIKYFSELQETPAPDPALKNTNLLIEKFCQEFSTKEGEKILSKGLSILTTGYQEGKKLYAGFEDAQDYVRRGLSSVDGIVDSTQGAGYLAYEDVLNLGNEFQPVTKISDYGQIHELNDHFGGIYTQSLISIAAPNKGGKTKFCMRLVYEAVTKYGQNVTLWPIEPSVAELVAELQAIHFDAMNNEGLPPDQCKTGVDKYTILHDKWDEPGFRHPDWKEQCRALALELASNPNYGRIDFIDKPLQLETFLDVLDVSVKSNGSSMVYIDYLPQITSQNPRHSKHEIIAQAYPAALNYVKRNNITLISPAQFTQDAIRDLAKSGEEGKEMRTSLGGSSEITRSSDITIALWASTQSLSANRMKIMSIPSRVNGPFETFEVITDLASCTFMSQR